MGDTRESRALLVQSQDFVIPRLALVVQRRGETGIGDKGGRGLFIGSPTTMGIGVLTA